jgi:hypothetical protein
MTRRLTKKTINYTEEQWRVCVRTFNFFSSHIIKKMSLPLSTSKREIGKTGIKVSAVGLGCMSLVSIMNTSNPIDRETFAKVCDMIWNFSGTRCLRKGRWWKQLEVIEQGARDRLWFLGYCRWACELQVWWIGTALGLTLLAILCRRLWNGS